VLTALRDIKGVAPVAPPRCSAFGWADLEVGMRVADDIVAANGLFLIGAAWSHAAGCFLFFDRPDQLLPTTPADRDRRAGADRAPPCAAY